MTRSPGDFGSAGTGDWLGRTLGHFRVLSVLGRGGMGIVYQAEDVDLWRPVALKVLPPDHASDPRRRARFLREARSAAAVAHANVATIYEVGASDATAWIAMELIHGSTLREELRRGLDRARALAIAIGVARGVARAHEVGVLHRDLKPENVMLGREGEAKVLDFGLAQALRESDPETAVAATMPAEPSIAEALGGRLTLGGGVVGTPGYLSPEQARGAPLDARSDVFAFGILLYELLTGKAPFGGTTTMEQVISVIRDDPPPLVPTLVSPAVAAVVMRCLAREPERRFADAGEVRDALIAARDADRPFSATVARGTDAEDADTLDAASPVIDSGPESAFVELRADAEPLLGRTRELAAVLDAFDAGERWVTLVGAGGIGKTRLAREVARRLRTRERRPARVAALGAIRSFDDAVAVLAGALGAEIPPGGDAAVALGLSLRSHGRVLLIADEAEGVARPLGELLAAVLGAAPEASVLCTSRERLRTGGAERAIEIGPLDSDAGRQLFLDRARAVRKGLRDDESTRAIAGEIAARLDGSPLAIELAAARAAVLAPAAIRDRLDDRLRLLAGASRDDRHGSLRAVLEWSWSLLDDAERAVLAQVAIFRSGAGVDAIEAIVVAPGGAYVVDVLDSLRAKSLLRVAEDGSGATRFTMDESVRVYAEESLSASPAEHAALAARHASWYARAAQDAAAVVSSGLDDRGDRWLELERDNLLAAGDRALAGTGPSLDDGALAISALARSRGEQGAAGAARDRLTALVERAGQLGPAAAAELLCTSVRYDVDRQVAAVRPRAARAVELAARTSDAALRARARSALVLAIITDGEPEVALEVAERWVAEEIAGGDDQRLEAARLDLARALWRCWRIADALAEIDAAVASARLRRARRALPEMILVQGTLLTNAGELERAAAAEGEALAAARAEGLDRVVGNVLVNLGLTLQALGRLDEARAVLTEALERLERRGQTILLAVGHGNLGFLEHSTGAVVLAQSHYERAIALLARIGERRWHSIYRAARAVTLAESDRLDEAERDFEAAAALAASIDEPTGRDVIAVLRGHLEVARARHTTDADARAALIGIARSRIEAAYPLTSRSDVIRNAIRSLEWALAKV